MNNWSGHLVWSPDKTAHPSSEEEIRELVLHALENGKNIRTIGAGHSFTSLCETDDILVSLDHYQGLIAVDKNKMTATVRAGTRLYLLNELLFAQGMALENLGDIDQQSIAGAAGTGTHGTGAALGNISTLIRAIRLIDGKGETRECSPEKEPQLFRAAQVSLGALGIITEITLQCVPAFNLELQIGKTGLEEVIRSFPELNARNKHFEYYWFPHSGYAMTKRLNPTDETEEKEGFGNFVQEYVLENYGFQLMCDLSRWIPSATPGLSRFSGRTVGPYRKVSRSYKAFCTRRLVRFNEMEYSIPLAAYGDVMKEIAGVVNRQFRSILFPIESRVVQGDDIPLSPAYARDSAYIACHVYHKKDFRAFFTRLEDIFRAADGRPHWGKIHNLQHRQYAEAYPDFQAFDAIRRQCDPEGVFLNAFLRSVFGISA